MIHGKTTMHLSAIEMNRALEHYLNEKVLKNPVEVTAIKKEPNGIDHGFAVDVTPRDETEVE